MKILITGGAGFIGSHLVRACLDRGDHVTVVDNLATGRKENIQQALSKPNFKFFEDSILNEKLMDELVSGCDQIYHLAAAVGVKYILENPFLSLTTNISGTEMVLSLAKKHRKKVLIASSSEVYGKQNRDILKENDDVCYGPSQIWRWSYAASKLADEYLAHAYFKDFSLPVVIVRFFNTVGPGQMGRYGMVIPRFIKQALQNEAITVYGDGTQSRTFTYVADAVMAVLKLMESDKALGQVVNVGGIEEVSIANLAKKIKAKIGSASPVEFIPYEKAYELDSSQIYEDILKRVPSLEKLHELTGYSPTTNLDQILDQTIHWMKKDFLK